MASIGDLGASVNLAIERIQEARVMINDARDTGSEALALCSQVTDGSGSALTAAVLGALAIADNGLEEILARYRAAEETLVTYKSINNLP